MYGLFIDDHVLQQMNLMSLKTGIWWKSSILVSQSSWPILLNSVSGGLDYIWVMRRTADWAVVRSLTPCTRRARQKRSLLNRPAVVRGLYPSTLVESQGFPGSDGVGNHVTSFCWCTALYQVGGRRSCLPAHFRDLPSVNQLYGDADFIIEQQLVPFRFIVIFKSFETPNVGFSFAVSYEDNISYTVCKSIHESLFLTGISDINPLF